MTTQTRERSAEVGRKQPCVQCGASYLAYRAKSRFCSKRCTKRAQRCVQPVASGATERLKVWLLKKGYAGRIGGATYGLTVPLSLVLGDLNDATERLRAAGHRTVGRFTEAGLKDALRSIGLQA